MVSTRKKDVVDMLKFFNIKIDNPLVFMEQTTMKQFIQGDEKGKYDILMQAMNFKSLQQFFDTTDKQLASMRDILSKCKEVELKKKLREVEEAKESLQMVRGLKGKEMKLNELRRREAWAEIQDREAKIEELVEEMNSTETAMQEMNNKIDRDTKLLEEANASNEEKKSEIEALKQELDIQREQKDVIMRELDESTRPLGEAQIERERCQRELMMLKRQIESNRQNVLRLTESMAKLMDSESEKKEIEQLHHDLKSFEEQLQSLSEQTSAVEAKRQELSAEIASSQSQRESIMQGMNEARNDLNGLKTRENELKGMSSPLTKYGRSVADLQVSISRQSWESRVFYPAGEFFSVRKGYEEWRDAIEIFLNSFPLSAIVNIASRRDRQGLISLAQRHGVSDLNVISVDYEGNLLINENQLPMTQKPSILDALEFKSSIVKKAAIVQTRLERCILCHDYNEVLTVTGDGPNRAMPRNVQLIVTIEGDLHRVNRGKPSLTSNRKKPQGYLSLNTEEALRMIRVHIEEARQNEEVWIQKDRAWFNENRSRQDAMVEMKKQLREFDSKKRQVSNQIRQIQDRLDRIAQEDGEGELASMRNQQQQIEEDTAQKEQKLEQVSSRIEALDQRIVSLQSASDSVTNRFRDMQMKVSELESKILRITQTTTADSWPIELGNRIKLTQQAKHKLEEKRELLAKQIEAKKDEVRSSVALLGEETRVREKLSVQRCQKEVELFEESLRKEREQMGVQSNAELEAKYEAKRKEFDELRAKYKSIKREGLRIDKLEKRQKLSYDELRNESQQQICKRFTRFLSQRKAEGSVTIDHDQHTVSLSVRMDFTSQVESSQVQNIKVLSGGEKSFVTLSLIMATAHIIESPFFIMDEFDVFMDEAIRVISLHSIIETARQEQKQFIFITPHNLETVFREMNKDKDNKDIAILKMNDPQQGRTFWCVCFERNVWKADPSLKHRFHPFSLSFQAG